VTVVGAGGQVPVYVDLVGFEVGRCEVTGIFTNVATPLPPSFQQSVMRTLVARAQRYATSADKTA
jgi:hypothetical protein